MSNALNKINRKVTPQTEQADVRQKRNNAGGFSFTVSEWDRLERFLILGTEKGTYYVGEHELTKQNVAFLEKLLAKDPQEVIRRTVAVSNAGRAKSNKQAEFVLALAMQLKLADKQFIKDAVPQVARTFTHLAEYATFLDNLGGWGRSKKDSIVGWYEGKTDQQLAVQAIKYRSRKTGEKQTWTHGDMLRKAHPKNVRPGLANFILGKEYAANDVPSIVIGFEKAQHAKSEAELIGLISEYGLPWEAIPTEWHKSLKVWRALYDAGMGQTALVRNVTRFARLGAFKDLKFAAEYANKLRDPELIRKGRMHPISYLNAAIVHRDGQVNRADRWGYSYGRTKNWETSSKIAGALEDGFYIAFGNVEPSNKRILLGVDVSGSMSCNAMGLDLSCAQVSAAVAMQIARTEPYSEIRGFSNQFVDLGITERDDFGSAMRKVKDRNFGGTDCSLPMQYALKNNIEIDTFVVVTDSETWAGRIHPHQALKQYRDTFGIPARLAVLGVAATDVSIADPSDKGMMDFAGFDASAPRVLADFSAGRI